MNCIICGKGGLIASTSECPQCNSDLSSFKLLDTIENESIARTTTKQKRPTLQRSWYRPAFWAVLLATGMFLTTTIWLYQTRNAGTDALTGQSKTVQSKLNALTTYLQQSRDSLALVLQNRPRQEDAERPGFEYLVKRGDSLSKIAYSILGDASRYDEIMRRNGLTETSLIYPGTKLQIEP